MRFIHSTDVTECLLHARHCDQLTGETEDQPAEGLVYLSRGIWAAGGKGGPEQTGGRRWGVRSQKRNTSSFILKRVLG